MSIEAAAQRMNDLGWTCTAHEPFHFGDCNVCHPIQMDAARAMVAAFAGDRVLYEKVPHCGQYICGTPDELVQVYPEVTE